MSESRRRSRSPSVGSASGEPPKKSKKVITDVTDQLDTETRLRQERDELARKNEQLAYDKANLEERVNALTQTAGLIQDSASWTAWMGLSQKSRGTIQSYVKLEADFTTLRRLYDEKNNETIAMSERLTAIEFELNQLMQALSVGVDYEPRDPAIKPVVDYARKILADVDQLSRAFLPNVAVDFEIASPAIKLLFTRIKQMGEEGGHIRSIIADLDELHRVCRAGPDKINFEPRDPRIKDLLNYIKRIAAVCRDLKQQKDVTTSGVSNNFFDHQRPKSSTLKVVSDSSSDDDDDEMTQDSSDASTVTSSPTFSPILSPMKPTSC